LICDITHSYVTSHSYGTWLIHMGDKAFVCDMMHSHVTWLIYKEDNVFTGDVTHLYVTWRIQKRSCRRANGRQTRPVWHSHVAWLIQVCRDSFESRHTWMSHDSLWCMRHVTLEWVTALLNESWLNESWLIQVCRDSHTKCAVTHMTHSSVPWLIYVWRDAYTRGHTPDVKHDLYDVTDSYVI